MAKWKVNANRQVVFGGVLYGPGETFEAPEGEVTADGIAVYLSKTKAQQPGANKAQQSSSNK